MGRSSPARLSPGLGSRGGVSLSGGSQDLVFSGLPSLGLRRGLRRLTAVAAAFALLCVWAHPLDAAPKRKKRRPPPPTNAGEIDAPASAPPAPAPPAVAPAPAPEPAAAASTPPADSAPEAASAPASPHVAAHAGAYAPLGAKHTLVLDDLSGFRASTAGGIGYAGPIGFSTQSYSVNVPGATTVAGTDTIHATTIWFAPSADYFLFENISIGAVIEVAWTSANYDQNLYNVPSKNQSLPSTVNFTFIPRAGYMLALGEHWGLWPRVGMGLGVLQQNAISQAGAASVSASSNLTYLLDVDAGVLYRLESRFYLRAGPEFTWGPGAGLVDLTVAGGFGYMWTL